MESYEPETYGEHIADVYDSWYAGYEEAAVTTLLELARGGPVLELGIGTGRLALPLKKHGLEIHGIDASAAMLEKLRAKPHGAGIPVLLGNFADVAVEGSFSLIFVVFNTFWGLLTQDEQVRCFQNVAQHLRPGGLFVIEAFVPDMTRFSGRQTVRTSKVSELEVQLEASVHDPVGQRVNSQHVVLSDQGARLYPVQVRYVWPSELDLMARLAGLRLQQRWSNWERGLFTAESVKHVSVYGFVI